MESWSNRLTDWVNLPENTEVASLWAGFHGAEISSIATNIEDQTLTIEMAPFFLPAHVKVLITFFGVKSVRVDKYPPPFQHLLTGHESFARRAQMAEGWESKWREESLGWPQFELLLETDPFQIIDADLAQGKDHIAVRIGGHLNGHNYNDLWCSVYVRAKSISVSRSDIGDFSLEQLVDVGAKWWKLLGAGKTA